jgi:hypothetical protein
LGSPLPKTKTVNVPRKADQIGQDKGAKQMSTRVVMRVKSSSLSSEGLKVIRWADSDPDSRIYDVCYDIDQPPLSLEFSKSLSIGNLESLLRKLIEKFRRDGFETSLVSVPVELRRDGSYEVSEVYADDLEPVSMSDLVPSDATEH